jgi:malonyl CoA-acyl carrier protein transacylase
MLTAYMFPGQGSQYKGMGEHLFKLFPTEVDEASAVLGYDIKELCLHDPEDKLNITNCTQPAIYFVSCLAFLEKQKNGAQLPNFVCGHSLGEYAALFVANVFDLITGLHIVKKRGELMGLLSNGSMMAVIGKGALNVGSILREKGLDTVDIANYNTSEQLVLSGKMDDLNLAQNLLEKEGFRCVKLNVSGAFHSRYMQSIKNDYMRFLLNFDFSPPQIKLISTTTAQELENNYILETLGYQLVRGVQWYQTILNLQSRGVRNFVELGPGDILTRLNKKILKEI